MDSRRSSRQDLRAQLENLEKNMDSKLIRRSTSLYGLDKDDQALKPSSTSSSAEKSSLSNRNKNNPLRNSIHHVNDREPENFKFMKDLSDNLLLQCRKLQTELDQAKKQVTNLELQNQHLTLTKDTLDSHNLELTNELSSLQDELRESSKTTNVNVNDQNNVVLSQFNYKNLVNNSVDRISKEDLLKFISSRFNLRAIPYAEYENLIKPMNEQHLQAEAAKLGFVAMPRQNFDLIKAKSESPDEKTITSAASKMGLTLVRSKELHNLKNPSKHDLEKKIKKLGFVMIPENSTTGNTSETNLSQVFSNGTHNTSSMSLQSATSSPMASKFAPSSKVSASREFFEQVIREENKKDVVLESGRSLGFVRLSTDQYKKLLEGQKEHVLTKSDIYAGAKDYQLTVLPNEEYKALLRKKNYTDSLSFDDINEFAKRLQLKLIPLTSNDPSVESSRRSSSQLSHFTNNHTHSMLSPGPFTSRSKNYSTDSLLSSTDFHDPRASVDSALLLNKTRQTPNKNVGKGVSKDDHHDEKIDNGNSEPSREMISKSDKVDVYESSFSDRRTSVPEMTLDQLAETCKSKGCVLLKKEEYEALKKPPTIEYLKEHVAKNNLKLLTPEEISKLQSKDHLQELLEDKYKVVSREELQKLQQPTPVSLESVKEFVNSKDLKILSIKEFETLQSNATKPEVKEKCLQDFAVQDVKQYLETANDCTIMKKSDYNELMHPKPLSLNEWVEKLQTQFPNQLVIEKSKLEDLNNKQLSLDELKQNLSSNGLKTEIADLLKPLPLEDLQTIASTKYGYSLISEDALTELQKEKPITEKELQAHAPRMGLVVLKQEEHELLKSAVETSRKYENMETRTLQTIAESKGFQLVPEEELKEVQIMAEKAKNLSAEKSLSKTELMKQASQNGFSMIPQAELKEMETKISNSKITLGNLQSQCEKLDCVALPKGEFEELQVQLKNTKEFDLEKEAEKQGMVLLSSEDYAAIKKYSQFPTDHELELGKQGLIDEQPLPNATSGKNEQNQSVLNGNSGNCNSQEKAMKSSTLNDDQDMKPSKELLQEEASKLGMIVVPEHEFASSKESVSERGSRQYNIHEEAEKLGSILLSQENYMTIMKELDELNKQAKRTVDIRKEAEKQGFAVLKQKEFESLQQSVSSMSKKNEESAPTVTKVEQDAKKLGLVTMNKSEFESLKEAIVEAQQISNSEVEHSKPNIEEEARKQGLIVLTKSDFEVLKQTVEEAQNAVKFQIPSDASRSVIKEVALKQGLIVMTKAEFDSLKELLAEAENTQEIADENKITGTKETSSTSNVTHATIEDEASKLGLVVLSQKELNELKTQTENSTALKQIPLASYDIYEEAKKRNLLVLNQSEFDFMQKQIKDGSKSDDLEQSTEDENSNIETLHPGSAVGSEPAKHLTEGETSNANTLHPGSALGSAPAKHLTEGETSTANTLHPGSAVGSAPAKHLTEGETSTANMLHPGSAVGSAPAKPLTEVKTSNNEPLHKVSVVDSSPAKHSTEGETSNIETLHQASAVGSSPAKHPTEMDPTVSVNKQAAPASSTSLEASVSKHIVNAFNGEPEVTAHKQRALSPNASPDAVANTHDRLSDHHKVVNSSSSKPTLLNDSLAVSKLKEHAMHMDSSFLEPEISQIEDESFHSAAEHLGLKKDLVQTKHCFDKSEQGKQEIDKDEPQANESRNGGQNDWDLSVISETAKKHDLVLLSKVKYRKLLASSKANNQDFSFDDDFENTKRTIESEEGSEHANFEGNTNVIGQVPSAAQDVPVQAENSYQRLEKGTIQTDDLNEPVGIEQPAQAVLNKNIITERAKEFGLIAIEESQFNEITNQLASQELSPEEIVMKAREYGFVSIEHDQFAEIKEELENPHLSKEQLARIALEQHNLVLIDKNEYRELKRSDVNDYKNQQPQRRSFSGSVPSSPSVGQNPANRTNSLIKVHQPIRQVSLSNPTAQQRQSSVSSLHPPQLGSSTSQPSQVNENNSSVFVPTLPAPGSFRNKSNRTNTSVSHNFKEEAKKNGFLCLPESCYIAPSFAGTTTISPSQDFSNEDHQIDSERVVVLPKEHYTALLESYTNAQTNMINDSSSHRKRSENESSGSVSRTHQAHDVSNVTRDDVSLKSNASLTDYNVIAALTQTVIGEYLYKYYPKFGILTKVRHERYFWIHPYTMTLYWSHSNPSMSSNVSSYGYDDKTKGCAIVDVLTVEDSNPYPPGLYHKSIIIRTDHHKTKEIKITCPTRSRHNIWYNSLKYLVENNNVSSANASSGFKQVSTQVVKNTSAHPNRQAQSGHSISGAQEHVGRHSSSYNRPVSDSNEQNSYFFVKSLADENSNNNNTHSTSSNKKRAVSSNKQQSRSASFLSKTFGRS
ncbi:hypothetical protein ACO0QE_002713 [Hanseniaspora vineae]